MELVKKESKKSRWVDEYHVNWYDADCTGRLSLPALCGFLEETSWRHANHLNIGWTEANKQHNAWVLVRMQMQIDEWPLWNQAIRVVTWPRGVDKLFAYRDFRIEDMKGRILVHVTSTWLVLDIESRRPVRPELVKDALTYILPDRALSNDATKLNFPHINDSNLLGEIKVSYPDIDLNGHTNNIRYTEWILRHLPEKLLKENPIKHFAINYLAESHIGDDLKLYSEGDFTNLSVGGIRQADNKNVFAAQFRF